MQILTAQTLLATTDQKKAGQILPALEGQVAAESSPSEVFSLLLPEAEVTPTLNVPSDDGRVPQDDTRVAPEIALPSVPLQHQSAAPGRFGLRDVQMTDLLAETDFPAEHPMFEAAANVSKSGHSIADELAMNRVDQAPKTQLKESVAGSMAPVEARVSTENGKQRVVERTALPEASITQPRAPKEPVVLMGGLLRSEVQPAALTPDRPAIPTSQPLQAQLSGSSEVGGHQAPVEHDVSPQTQKGDVVAVPQDLQGRQPVGHAVSAQAYADGKVQATQKEVALQEVAPPETPRPLDLRVESSATQLAKPNGEVVQTVKSHALPLADLSAQAGRDPVSKVTPTQENVGAKPLDTAKLEPVASPAAAMMTSAPAVVTGQLQQDLKAIIQSFGTAELSSPADVAVEEADFAGISNMTSPASDVKQAMPLMRSPELPRHIAAQLMEVARSLPDGPVELTLSPEELGRLRITFQADAGQMNVALSFDRPETLDLMRRHIDMLAQDMRELGYDQVNFSFNQNGDGGQQGGSQNGFSHGAAGAAFGQVTEAEVQQLTRMTLDGVDIRI